MTLFSSTLHRVQRWDLWKLSIVAVAALIGFQFAGLHPASAGQTITGSGSSYAAVAINNWTGQVSNLYGASVNYQTSSSVLGLDAFCANQVDFAASEIGYNAGQASCPPGQPAPGTYQYMPDVAGATCLMYNLQSTTSQPIRNLQIDSATMMGIFSGKILYWDDSAMKEINPGAALPHAFINPVVRSDASGDNYIFSQYLSSLQGGEYASFNSTFTPSYSIPSAQWPSATANAVQNGFDLSHFVPQAGSDNASNYVASYPNTITYVETAYAILHGSACAAVKNASGSFVQPSAVADAIALTHDCLNADLTQNLNGCNGDPGVFNAPEPEAYPISAYSYLIASTNISAQKAAVLAQFIHFMACQGQVSAGQLGYSPIPPNLILDDFAAIGRLPGQKTPDPPTAQNCPNPYLTGAMQYVGGPIQLSTGGSGGASAAATGSVDVKQVSAASAAQSAAVKGSNGLYQAGGQKFGIALNAAVANMLSEAGPGAAIAGVTAIFLAMIIVPPTVGLLRRRRRIRAEAVEGEIS